MTETQADRLQPLSESIHKGAYALASMQREDGRWWLPCRATPLITALTHLVMVRLGQAPPSDGPMIVRWIERFVLPDGSFADNVDDREGSVCATAGVLACLDTSGVPADDPLRAGCQQWLDARGGMNAIIAVPVGVDALAVGPLLAWAGYVDPERLAEYRLPIAQTLIPEVNELLGHEVNAGLLFAEQLIAGMLRSLTGRLEGPLHDHERARIIGFAETFQDPSGSWNGASSQTVLAMAALQAMGLPADHEVLRRAAQFIRSYRIELGDTLHYPPFGSAIWDTSLTLTALMHCGVSPRDARITAGVRYLVRTQRDNLQVSIDNPGPLTRDEGGWAFEGNNPRLPDCDDTGLAMMALGIFQRAAEPDPSLAPLSGEARDANASACQWLLGMQHSDGGWGAYMRDQPRRVRGVLYTHPLMDFSGVSPEHPVEELDLLRRFVADSGDRSTAGLTGRVLTGMGWTGATLDSPGVGPARAFLRRMQGDHGAWFGRWICNYLAGTSWALRGLAAVDVDASDPDVARAVDFVRQAQNDDGGWGDVVRSYTDPALAGRGWSMPGLTGLVAGSLLLLGLGDDPMVSRAIDYLLTEQHPDGTWSNEGWMHVMIPPLYFYGLPSGDLAYPLEALGLYQAHVAGCPCLELRHTVPQGAVVFGDDGTPTAPVRTPDGAWSIEGLRAWRTVGDPPADALVRRIFDRAETASVNAVFDALVRNDAPIPTDVDPEVAQWFEDSGRLPDGYDPALIARAHDFYVREGWKIALCLFTSSLPQAYAAANGARVLVATQGMSGHTRRRILETAQFIVDVLEPGAFEPGGRGIRAPQKVRLMHATVRQLILGQGTWQDGWGVPINQEDLAGTLMTFSVVILDGLERLGTPLPQADVDAWLHLWWCIGHLMGVRPRFIPSSRADAAALMQAIRQDQWASSEHGIALTVDLEQAMAEYLPVPDRYGRRLAGALVRAMAGQWCADLLQIPHAPWAEALVGGGISLERHLAEGTRAHHRATALQTLATGVMQALIDVQREGKQTRFRLPMALLRAWTLAD